MPFRIQRTLDFLFGLQVVQEPLVHSVRVLGLQWTKLNLWQEKP